MALLRMALVAMMSASLADIAQARSHIFLRGGKNIQEPNGDELGNEVAVTPVDAPDLELMNKVAGKLNYGMDAEDPESVYEATEKEEDEKEEAESHEPQAPMDTPSDVLDALGSSYEASQKTQNEPMKTPKTVEHVVRPTKKIAEAVIREAAKSINQVATVAAPVKAVAKAAALPLAITAADDLATGTTQAITEADDADQDTTIDAAGLDTVQDVAAAPESHAPPAGTGSADSAAILSATKQIIATGHAAKKKIASLVKKSGQVQHRSIDNGDEANEDETASDSVEENGSGDANAEESTSDVEEATSDGEQSDEVGTDTASDESAEDADSEANSQEDTSDTEQSDAVSDGSVDAEDESAQEANAQETE